MEPHRNWSLDYVEKVSATENAREVQRLREAIKAALSCTPHIRQVQDVRIPMGRAALEIIYDCGDPWEILREALKPPAPSGN